MANRRIVIVGFMGSGKSRVARELSLILQRPFVDLDDWITKHIGRSPKEIIEADGEESFRNVETEALAEVLAPNEGQVIAAGGGAWTVERNRQLIIAHEAFTVWLDASFDLCWERIECGSERRPLAPSREAAENLFQLRQPTYALAEARIPVFDKDAQDIASQIAALFRSASRI